METFSNQFVSTLHGVFCAGTEKVGLKCRSGEGEQDREPPRMAAQFFMPIPFPNMCAL
jgi:hypothetical protein